MKINIIDLINRLNELQKIDEKQLTLMASLKNYNMILFYAGQISARENTIKELKKIIDCNMPGNIVINKL